MKIITVIGARPQFIKAAALSRELSKHKGIEEIIIHTGQHFDENMSDVFFEQMDIPKPKFNLNINGLTHGAMTGQMLEKIEKILIQEAPDIVVVYGDTNSTLAGALAAKKLHIKIAHIEAGLRSFNMDMPEEINRILTDRISDILFCPTQQAINNLINEGFIGFNNYFVNCGDIMQDAALFYADKAISPLNFQHQKFILTTIHRAENTDDANRLQNIFESLDNIAKSIPMVIPLHPRTKIKLESMDHPFISKNITFMEPVGYFEMIWLLKNCELVMTDSGGLQKEAYFFKKPCITLRDETEWIELIENKFNILTGSNPTKIIEASKQFLGSRPTFNVELYGDGKTAQKIVKIISNL